MNTAVKTAPSEKPSSCLARQPILSKDEKVLGYERLFRESPQEDRFNADLEGGTRSIIDTLNVMGLDAVCDGRRAFINCSHDMLLEGFFLLLPAEKAVVEIQEKVPVDEPVVAACQQLRMEGYEIALDNFVPGDAREKLIPICQLLEDRHQKGRTTALRCPGRGAWGQLHHDRAEGSRPDGSLLRR